MHTLIISQTEPKPFHEGLIPDTDKEKTVSYLVVIFTWPGYITLFIVWIHSCRILLIPQIVYQTILFHFLHHCFIYHFHKVLRMVFFQCRFWLFQNSIYQMLIVLIQIWGWDLLLILSATIEVLAHLAYQPKSLVQSCFIRCRHWHQHWHHHLCTPPLGTGLDIETAYLVYISTYVPHKCTWNI